MPKAIAALAVITLVAALPPRADAADLTAREREYFEKTVRPVLVQYCYECHSTKAEKVKAGLLLDTQEGVLAGGKTGPAIVPGKPDESLLIKAIRYESKNLQMPPKEQLPERHVRALEQWVRMGAPDPRVGNPEPLAGDAKVSDAPQSQSSIDIEKGRAFWAYQPVSKPAPPKVRDAAWPRGDIDRFVLADIEKAKLHPVGDADRETLLRRATFDLVGLPPTVEELNAFLSDSAPTPKAFEKVVDRLLASPRFGERWGRHWLDVVRYAESIGKTRNYPFPVAWRYRDYVIAALNKDKPYNQFVREQVAGDLMPALNDTERGEHLIATGFLALGSQDLNERDNEVYIMDAVDEQIGVVGRSMLALTLGCARCHDHKFDPIAQTDYYAMAGIFRSTVLLNGYKSRGGGANKDYAQKTMFHVVPGGSDDEAQAAAAQAREEAQLRKQIAKVNEEIKTLENEVRAKGAKKLDAKAAEESKKQRQELKAKQAELKQLQSKLKGGSGDTPNGDLAMGVRDAGTAVNCRVNIKGDVHDLGPMVPRGFVQVVDFTGNPRIASDGSGRLELADWLASDRNPLTARVMVNRVWHHLFGAGIVPTVDNFGKMGDQPTRPELLDHLASRFMAGGWSTKQLIRDIMLSRTYQLSSAYDAGNYDADPDNVLLWRSTRRRLEVEAIRDAMLTVSGRIDLNPPIGSAVSSLKQGEISATGSIEDAAFDSRYRSVYLPIVRQYVPDMLTTFDFAEPSDVKGAREVTTVAPQALFMMNSRFVLDQSRAAADTVLRSGGDGKGRAVLAYRTALGRRPTDAEVNRVLAYVAEETSRDAQAAKPKVGGAAERDAWTDVMHALLASAEFRYVQ